MLRLPDWFKIATQVISMIVQYGPGLWKMAREVYSMVEEMVSAWKTRTGKEPTSDEKAALFNSEMEKKIAANPKYDTKQIGRGTINVLRESVWASKNPAKAYT